MIARVLQWALNKLFKQLEKVANHIEDVWDDEDEDWVPKVRFYGQRNK